MRVSLACIMLDQLHSCRLFEDGIGDVAVVELAHRGRTKERGIWYDILFAAGVRHCHFAQHERSSL